MKVIDLLNKIANGEEVPKKIKFCLRNFEFSKYKQDYFCRDNDEQGIYGMSICKWLFLPLLNDEVEIIEEPQEHKIPEKLDLGDYTEINSKNDMEYKMFEYIFNKNANAFYNKINEILDYLEVNNDRKRFRNSRIKKKN